MAGALAAEGPEGCARGFTGLSDRRAVMRVISFGRLKYLTWDFRGEGEIKVALRRGL
jgi:hypothetical protein